MDKTGYMMGNTTREMPVLEVGPSYNPIVTKADGWNVHVVDHATKSELESKYRQWNVDVSRMEEVDYIWQGGPLHEAIPAHLHGKYERVLASHVIEHMPDMLTFLQSISTLLSPTGTLALAVPDKRFCFDFMRPCTLTSDVITANMVSGSNHTAKAAYETYFYHANAGGSIAWSGAPPGKIVLHHGWQVSVDSFNMFCDVDQTAYIDMHASCFTPCSFELIILELAALGLCDLTVRNLYRTNGYEFFVVLDKTGELLSELPPERVMERRLALLRGMLEETWDQVELLRKSEAPAVEEVAAEAVEAEAVEAEAVEAEAVEAEAGPVTDSVVRADPAPVS